jgi:hypothetical protein
MTAQPNPATITHKDGCDGASCQCAPPKPLPTLTPISRLFLMIAGAMFGLFILRYFGVSPS